MGLCVVLRAKGDQVLRSVVLGPFAAPGFDMVGLAFLVASSDFTIGLLLMVIGPARTHSNLANSPKCFFAASQ